MLRGMEQYAGGISIVQVRIGYIFAGPKVKGKRGAPCSKIIRHFKKAKAEH